MTANMGHAPWHLAWPILKALARGMGQAWYSPNAIREQAHKELATILPPGFKQTVFVVTGSEAVEVACRSAMKLRPGKAIAHLHGNYHGSTTWVQENLNGGKGASFEWGGPYPEGVGVVIVTPYLAAWCKWATEDEIEKFSKWVRDELIILIDDEIQSGFGRCGTWWGFQRYDGLHPHIIVAGKAATGLLPLSFVSYIDAVADFVREEDYISTHSGNPICLAAMNANIAWMRKADAPELAREIYVEITRVIDGWWGLENLIMGYDGRGAAVSIYLRSKEQAKQVIDAVSDRVLLFDTGLPLIKIAPPLNIKCRDLLQGLGIIRDAITGVAGAKSSSQEVTG